MTIDTIEADFRRTVGESVRLANEGLNRYRVFTPFLFEDGDHLAVVLKREDSRWVLTDEGHTYMHLTYDLDERDLQRGNRQKIISNALSVFSVEDREGELRLLIPDAQFGDGLFSFIQALLKTSAIPTYLRDDWYRDWGSVEQYERVVPADEAPNAVLDQGSVTVNGWARQGPIRALP